MRGPAFTGGVFLQFKRRSTPLLLGFGSHILPNDRFVGAYRGRENSSCLHPAATPGVEFPYNSNPNSLLLKLLESVVTPFWPSFHSLYPSLAHKPPSRSL